MNGKEDPEDDDQTEEWREVDDPDAPEFDEPGVFSSGEEEPEREDRSDNPPQSEKRRQELEEELRETEDEIDELRDELERLRKKEEEIEDLRIEVESALDDHERRIDELADEIDGVKEPEKAQDTTSTRHTARSSRVAGVILGFVGIVGFLASAAEYTAEDAARLLAHRRRPPLRVRRGTGTVLLRGSSLSWLIL